MKRSFTVVVTCNGPFAGADEVAGPSFSSAATASAVSVTAFASHAAAVRVPSGFAVGATYPSRDMLVRAVTPPGAFGTVFGFVSTGFNIGASIAPIVYGMLMDHGQPRAIFFLSAGVSLVCVSTVTLGLSRRQAG